MSLQQVKTLLGYLLIFLAVFILASHAIWPAIDLALPIFLFIMLVFGVYFYIDQIKETTLCLIVKDHQVLMMYRNKKKNDVHINKYNGLGGSLEKGESKKQCVLREVKEEAGIELTKYYYTGKVRFKDFGYKKGNQIMYCYVGFEYSGEIGECNEGDLIWVNQDEVLSLPLWEGDQYFIMSIIENHKFKGYIQYEGDKVVDHHFKINKVKSK